MEIENIDIKKIIPYEKNPRKNDKAAKIVAKSIKEFGFRVPIILDKDNVIIAGHTRLKAAEKLGITEIPCLRANNLTPEQVKAFRIMDNKSSEFAEWDLDLLKIEFENLDEMEYDLEFTGFDLKEIGDIWKEKQPKEDDFEIPKEPKYQIEQGEIWQLGEHRLMCGDSTKKEHVDALMDGNKADMVFTDPPYGMFLETNFADGMGKKHGSTQFTEGHNYNKVIGDHKDFKPELITTIFDNFDYCKEIFIFGADYFSDIIPSKNKGSWMVWDKKEQGKEFDFTLSEFELFWSKAKHSRKIARFEWRGVIGLGKEDTKKRMHPTQKPLGLLSWVLKKFKLKSENITDLFGGSGSTLIACEQIKRKCYMMEIDPFYCSVIIERWEKLTGNKAEKLK